MSSKGNIAARKRINRMKRMSLAHVIVANLDNPNEAAAKKTIKNNFGQYLNSHEYKRHRRHHRAEVYASV